MVRPTYLDWFTHIIEVVFSGLQFWARGDTLEKESVPSFLWTLVKLLSARRPTGKRASSSENRELNNKQLKLARKETHQLHAYLQVPQMLAFEERDGPTPMGR